MISVVKLQGNYCHILFAGMVANVQPSLGSAGGSQQEQGLERCAGKRFFISSPFSVK
jgi:hypothetical protein